MKLGEPEEIAFNKAVEELKTLLITGSHLWTDYVTIHEELGVLYVDGYRRLIFAPETGAGRITQHVGDRLGFCCVPKDILAGQNAHVRNAAMFAFENPDMVVAFREKGRNNRDCDDCIEQAKERGIKLKVIKR